jgi:hypothetical protein
VKILKSYLAPAEFEADGTRIKKGTWLLARSRHGRRSLATDQGRRAGGAKHRRERGEGASLMLKV